MLEVVNNIISSIILFISWGYIIAQILDKKINIKNKKNIIFVILMIIISYIAGITNIGFSKTLIIYCTFTFFYKYIYNISYEESAILNFISISLHCIAEIILAIIMYLLKVDNNILKMLNFTPLSGLMVMLLTIFLIFILKKVIIKIYLTVLKKKHKILFYILLLLSISILFNININLITLSSKNLIYNIITIIIFSIIIFFLFKEKLTMIKINNQFNEVYNNSREVSSLLEKYRKINHENENDLRFIRGKSQDNKEVVDYIDDILKEKNIKDENRWISELNKINEPGINSFLSIKINNMIDNKMKIMVEVSNKVKKYDFNKLTIKEQKNLCRMLGVYLDNAYQAAKKSKDKTISVEINIIKKELRIIISNSFKGKIEIDKIGKYGYTTKGKGHGAGLSLVNDIINEDNTFTHNTKVINNFFFQSISIVK